MTNNGTSPAKIAAAWLVEQAAKSANVKPDQSFEDALAVAVERDLNVKAAEAVDDHARLAVVETQTRVLAEAVIAITHPDGAIATAIKAVKATMTCGTASPSTPLPSSVENRLD